MKSIVFYGLIALLTMKVIFAQEKTYYTIGIDVGQLAANNLNLAVDNIAGEVGINLGNLDYTILFRNIQLSEEHLSSDFARSVEGKNIEGKLTSYELITNFNLGRGFYLGPSLGYVKNFYEHTESQENIRHESTTAGMAMSYKECNILGAKGICYKFIIPIKYYFNELPETRLENSKVNEHKFESNLAFIIAYRF